MALDHVDLPGILLAFLVLLSAQEPHNTELASVLSAASYQSSPTTKLQREFGISEAVMECVGDPGSRGFSRRSTPSQVYTVRRFL